MNTIFYALIFIIGTLFGSFYTLAVYRIPKRQDITHTHSYCPNCDHKLGFLDLIPILSYIFLGAKCRYCKRKIRPRYFILEILSGVLFLSIAVLTNFSIDTLTATKIIEFSFFVLYLTYIILICGIDKETKKMDKLVSVYGIVISILYMVYLCIVEQASIYRYGIYLVFFIIILLIDTITLKKYAKNSYINGILLMIIIMAVFTNEYILISGVILSLLTIAIYMLIYKIDKKIKNKHAKNIAKDIPIGFCLGVCNIIWTLLALVFNYI